MASGMNDPPMLWECVIFVVVEYMKKVARRGTRTPNPLVHKQASNWDDFSAIILHLKGTFSRDF